MKRPARSTFLLIALALTLAAAARVDAEPHEITEREVAAADELRASWPEDQQAVVNALRFLMRPQFTEAMLEGRSRHACVLPPFEAPARSALSTAEVLRVIAVLRSGMPVTSAVEMQAARLAHNDVPRSTVSLGEHALHVLLAVEARRLNLSCRAALREHALRVLDAAGKADGATAARSPPFTKDFIAPRWFANIMWRVIMARAAVELGATFNSRQLERDVRELCDAFVRNRGWVSSPRSVVRDAGFDLQPNLMAFATLGLASGFEAGTFSRVNQRALDAAIEKMPAVLTRLDADFESERWVPSRLVHAATAPAAAAPESKSPVAWRNGLIRRALGLQGLNGAFGGPGSHAIELGLHAADAPRAEVQAVETSLAVIALAGGWMPRSEAPLHDRDLVSIGRIMHAQAVVQATRTPTDTIAMNESISHAISSGCDWLAQVQQADGRFPGQMAGYAGNTAMALLALLHGGWDRNSHAIQSGLKWLETHALNSQRKTYSHAVVLMFFQKYYEREQAEAGILHVKDATEFEAARRKVRAALAKPHARLIESMVRDIDGAHVRGTRGGWGYEPARIAAANHSDNSCSQYALLGYKAASLLGADIDVKLLTSEAERLISQYVAESRYKEVEYVHRDDARETGDTGRDTRSVSKEKITPGGWGYSCGAGTVGTMQLTGAGISSLTICMDELKIRGQLPRSLAKRIGLTIRGAEAFLRHTYYTERNFEGARNALAVSHADGWGVFYNLYSVERGCVLADIRKLDGEVDWYRIGADALVQNQSANGSWGTDKAAAGSSPMVVNTCMAILFLKQAAMPVITEHKKRETEREAREKEGGAQGPITGEPKRKAPTE